MDFGFSFYFDHLYLRGGFYHNLLFHLFHSLVVDDAFDLVDDFLDFLTADLDLGWHFDSSLNFHNIVDDSGIGPFLSDGHGHGDFFFVFELNNFRDLNKFGGGDELVDGNGDQFLIDEGYYFLNLDKYLLDLFNSMLNFNDFILLNFHHNFISHLNYFILFDCHHFFLMDGDAFGIFLQD